MDELIRVVDGQAQLNETVSQKIAAFERQIKDMKAQEEDLKAQILAALEAGGMQGRGAVGKGLPGIGAPVQQASRLVQASCHDGPRERGRALPARLRPFRASRCSLCLRSCAGHGLPPFGSLPALLRPCGPALAGPGSPSMPPEAAPGKGRGRMAQVPERPPAGRAGHGGTRRGMAGLGEAWRGSVLGLRAAPFPCRRREAFPRSAPSAKEARNAPHPHPGPL